MNRIIVLIISVLIFTTSCNKKVENNTVVYNLPADTIEKVMASINLTVSESKRLIAMGICKLPVIKEKLNKGMIIITRGSTNTYIAEELTGISINCGEFLTGHFVPDGVKQLNKGVKSIGELIIINGKIVDISYSDALKQIKPGDIILKGGNILNYKNKQAAVCIGAPDGGTTFRFLPYIGNNKANLIIPIGLEKETSADLREYEKILSLSYKRINFTPKLYLYKIGMIFTEIEALKLFADVDVYPYGVGGVAGREGGVSLVVIGDKKNVNEILKLMEKINGEKDFISNYSK